MFKDLKIGLRLGLGFGAVLSLTAVILMLGLYKMGQIHEELNHVVTITDVKMNNANAAAKAVLSISNNLRITNDEGAKIEQKNRIEAARKIYKDSMAKLKELEINPEGIQAIKDVEDALVPARAANEKFVELQLANKTAEASATLIKESVPLTQKVSDKYDKLIEYEAGRGRMRNEKAKQAYQSAMIWLVVFGMSALTIGTIISIITARRITVPLKKSVLMADRIANGDLSCEDMDSDSRDEVGILAEALNTMKKSLVHVIGAITDTSSHIASSSEELSATVAQITRRVDDQTGKANQVATASTEMSQTVLDMARNSSNIASSSKETLKTAEDGAAVVGKTVEEVREIADTVEDLAKIMTTLGQRSKHIGDILGVIQDIADQTNLLALNAAIEAARAGEQGRGFAVVADEVRKLAEKTSKSTSEIGGMIKAIQDETEKAVYSMGEGTKKVESGVRLATQAGVALNNIVNSVSGLESMVQQIASATEEMSSVSEQISSDIEVIASVSRETSEASRQIAQESMNLSKISANLKSNISRFKIK